ncbi:hypothetical protein FRC08_015258 [Ceratobasidium sp. 394]|nr:hypothetical protein FRC08_015258 [Ceratobasidium sp. 394]
MPANDPAEWNTPEQFWTCWPPYHLRIKRYDSRNVARMVSRRTGRVELGMSRPNVALKITSYLQNRQQGKLAVKEAADLNKVSWSRAHAVQITRI